MSSLWATPKARSSAYPRTRLDRDRQQSITSKFGPGASTMAEDAQILGGTHAEQEVTNSDGVAFTIDQFPFARNRYSLVRFACQL
jgi:hypothetical protein